MPGRKRRIKIGLAVCSLILGLLTTAAIVAGSVYAFPFQRPSLRGMGSISVFSSPALPSKGQVPTAAGRGGTGATWDDTLIPDVEATNISFPLPPSPPMSVRERVESIISPMTTEVATWGDHLQPWHIRLRTPMATRLVWFEKGRVYGKEPGVGPAQASSAAVSCWSFATDCWRVTNQKTTGPLPLPAAITELTQSNPRKAWGVAIEERGWPFRAATCRLIGTMDPNSSEAYVVEDGVHANQAVGTSGALQEQPVIPLRPLWPGLVADTVLMAGAWYGLLLLPGALLRAVRGWRGRCRECGYNLHGLTTPGCPECGWGRAPAESA